MPRVNYNGSVVNFPDGTSEADMSAALKTLDAPKQETDLHEPAEAQVAAIPAAKPFTLTPRQKDLATSMDARYYAQHPAAQTSENADVGAQHALDQSQEQAAKALQAPDPKAMQNGIRSALNEAPPVAEYAARSKDHAAAIGIDAAQLAAFHSWMDKPIDSSQQSWWQRWFSGPQAMRAPNEEERALAHENGLPEPSGVTLRPVGHGLFVSSLLQGVQSMATAFREIGSDLGSLISRHPGPHSPEENEADRQRALLRATSEQALQQRGREVAQQGGDTGPDAWVSKAVSSIPALGALAVAPEAAAPGLLFAQSYGSLRASGVEPGYAFAGGLTGALIGAGVGQKFLSGLALNGAAKTAQQAAAQTLTGLLLKPGWQQLGKSFGTHFASGWGMATGMGIADEAARMADHFAKTGEVPDSSELMTRFGQIAKDATTVAPFAAFGAYREYHAQQGRYVQALAGSTELRGLSDLINSMHLADSNPEVLKDILRHVVDTRRTSRQLDTAAQTAQDAGAETAGALTNAANSKRGELRAYVSNDAFVRAAKAMRVDPAELVRKVTQNDGQSWSDAQIMGIPISMKLENFLVDMKDAHETAISGTTLDPSHPPLDDVRKEEPITPEVLTADTENKIPGWGWWYDQRDNIKDVNDPRANFPELGAKFDNVKLNEIAKRGGATGPSKQEILDAYGRLQALGFQLPALPDVKVEGLGSESSDVLDLNAKIEAKKEADRKFAEFVKYMESRPRMSDAEVAYHRENMDPDITQAVREQLIKNEVASKTRGASANDDAPPEQMPAPREVKPNYKARAEEFIAGRTLGQLNTDQHAKAAKNAQTEMKRLSLAAVEKLAQATAKAQDATVTGLNKETGSNAAAKEGYLKSVGSEVKAGDKMQEYAAAERQFKLNSAIEKARQAAFETGQKITKAITAHGTPGARGKFYEGGQGTGSLSDLILQSVGKKTRDIPLSLEDAYGQLLSQGAELTFDGQKIADIIDKGVGLADMTLADAQNVKLALDNLKATAKRNARSETSDRQAARQEVIDTDIRPAAQAGAKGPAVIESIARLLKPTRIGNLIGSDADYANFGTLMQPWGKWGEQIRSWRIAARNNESKLFSDMEKSNVLKLPKELQDLAHEPIQWPAGMQSDYGFNPTRKDAWKIFAMTGTEEGLNSVARSWGISPEAIHGWLFGGEGALEVGPDGQPVRWQGSVSLTKPEADFVQNYWSTLKQWGDLIDATKSNAGGTPLTRQKVRDITTPHGVYKGGYSPFKWIKGDGLPSAPDPESADTHGIGSETAHGFTIDREKEGQPGDLPDPRWDNTFGQLASEAHYVTHNDLVREMHGMLNDPSFRQTVIETRGPEWLSRMMDSYKLIKDGRIQSDSNASVITTNLLQPLRRAVAASAFNMNFGVTVGQFAHPLVTKSALGLSTFDLGRGMYELLANGGWDFAEQNSQVVADRHRDSFRTVMQNLGDITGTQRSKLDMLQKPGHYINEGVDTTIARFAFLSKYYELLPKLGHDEATRQADLETEKVMPARSSLDQSKVVRDQKLGLYLLVRNFPNTIWNINAMDAWDTRSRISLGANTVQSYGGLISRRIGQTVGLGFGMYLMGHGRNAEEQENGLKGFGQAFGRTMLTEGVYGSLITHELMRTFGPLALQENFNPWSVKLFETPLAQYAHGLIRDVGVFAGGEKYDKALAALDVLSKTLGFNQLGKSSAGVKTVFIDKDFQNYGEAGSDLFYGTGPDSTIPKDIGQFSRHMHNRFGTPDPLRRH